MRIEDIFVEKNEESEAEAMVEAMIDDEEENEQH